MKCVLLRCIVTNLFATHFTCEVVNVSIASAWWFNAGSEKLRRYIVNVQEKVFFIFATQKWLGPGGMMEWKNDENLHKNMIIIESRLYSPMKCCTFERRRKVSPSFTFVYITWAQRVFLSSIGTSEYRSKTEKRRHELLFFIASIIGRNTTQNSNGNSLPFSREFCSRFYSTTALRFLCRS